MAAAADARAVYRAVLRAVDRSITSAKGNPWRQHIAELFREGRAEGDLAAVQRRLQHAKDYAFLTTSVREHKELLVSYFIGVQPEVREKSSNERAAARVGLKLPQLPDE